MIDRIHLREIDWVLTALIVANTLVGILLIYSASFYSGGGYAWKQLLWTAAGLVVFFLTISIDYKVWMAFAPYLYGLFLLFMAGLFLFGRTVAGSRSWIRVAFVGGQPSELAKVAVLLLLARVFSEYRAPFATTGMIALCLVLVGVPVGLILLQPDFGTAVCFVPILFGALILAGLTKKTLAVFLLGSVLLGTVGWNFLLKDYQKKRIETMIHPAQDPRGAGYHILQSQIAIGSGGLTGKGYLKGTQSRLRFLPARHTDFIFAVLGEDFGFAGVFMVMAAYFAMLARMFKSVGQSRDRSGIYITFLASSLIAFQFLVNILMIVGLLPITGIPIPLLSYGGSSLLATYFALGLIVNVKMRRFANV
ncbi:MAG: rod shape-determining protein RodA [Candidatus Aminicenantes bacterium]|nr:rod shape-determining protein RodA [Candidatus Aminicenantes bacterium]